MRSSRDLWSLMSMISLIRLLIRDPPRPPGRLIPKARIRAQCGSKVYPQGNCAVVNHVEIEGSGKMPSGATVRLSAESLRLELSPSIGGAISALEWIGSGGSHNLLRRCNSP